MKKISLAFLCIFLNFMQAYPRTTGIVSLSPALTEAVFMLGRGTLLAARSSACDAPREAAELPVAGNFGEIIPERLIELQPEYVITDTVIDASLTAPLEDAGIKFHILPCASFDQYTSSIIALGKLTGAEAEAEKITAQMQKERAAFRPLPRRIDTLWVIWPDPVIIAGQGTLPDEALKTAGLVNAAAEHGYFKPSAEWLWHSRAQLVIVSEKAGDISGHRLLGELPCVKRNRIIRLPAKTALERPGPGFLPAVRELQQKVLEMLK